MVSLVIQAAEASWLYPSEMVNFFAKSSAFSTFAQYAARES
jgi:hypothetical protein